MALVVKDRVKETTTSTGTGAITLAGAQANFRTFSSVLSNADTTYYAIIDNTNLDFEVGLGTYASSGNTITRTTVLSSSNSNSAVNFSAGTKDVILTYPADKAVYEESDGSVLIENLELNANAIKSTDTNGNIQLFPNGTGFTELYGNTNAGAVRFNCESNSHGVTLKGPPHSAGATYTLELPDATGSARQILNTNGSGKLAFTNSLPDPLLKSANYTAVAGDFVVATAGSITITLPASPSAGNAVTIKDGTGAAATTTFTVARNGSNIASSASDLTFDKNFAEITMTYINSTIGWSV
mgnify:FL=1|jgi:hypothetical protein|tara:strand:+ start:1111 stop:2004 length:894 start_codon:yes stop_codon:yes gene_type:complete